MGKFWVLADFIVLKMEEDAYVPIIMGQLFFAIARAIIDVKNKKLTFEIRQ